LGSTSGAIDASVLQTQRQSSLIEWPLRQAAQALILASLWRSPLQFVEDCSASPMDAILLMAEPLF
jgi:hypothetical protein